MSIGFDVLARRKVDLAGAALGCLTGGLNKLGAAGKAGGKAGKGEGRFKKGSDAQDQAEDLGRRRTPGAGEKVSPYQIQTIESPRID